MGTIKVNGRVTVVQLREELALERQARQHMQKDIDGLRLAIGGLVHDAHLPDGEATFGHSTLMALSKALARERQDRSEELSQTQARIASLQEDVKFSHAKCAELESNVSELATEFESIEPKMMDINKTITWIGKTITWTNETVRDSMVRMMDSCEENSAIVASLLDACKQYKSDVFDMTSAVRDEADKGMKIMQQKIKRLENQTTAGPSKDVMTETRQHTGMDADERYATRRQLRVEIAGMLSVDGEVAIDEALKPLGRTLTALNGKVLREFYIAARGSTVIILEFNTQLQSQRAKLVFSTRQDDGRWTNHLSYNERPLVVRFEKSAEAKRRDTALFTERSARIASGEIMVEDNLPAAVLKRRSLITANGVVVYAQ
jgi:hypothetical protein